MCTFLCAVAAKMFIFTRDLRRESSRKARVYNNKQNYYDNIITYDDKISRARTAKCGYTYLQLARIRGQKILKRCEPRLESAAAEANKRAAAAPARSKNAILLPTRDYIYVYIT